MATGGGGSNSNNNNLADDKKDISFDNSENENDQSHAVSASTSDNLLDHSSDYKRFSSKFKNTLESTENSPTIGYTCTYDAHTTDATDDSDTTYPSNQSCSSTAVGFTQGQKHRSSLKNLNHRQQRYLRNSNQNFNMHHRTQHQKQNNKKKHVVSTSMNDNSEEGNDLVIKSCLVHRNSLTSDEDTNQTNNIRVQPGQEAQSDSNGIQGIYFLLCFHFFFIGILIYCILFLNRDVTKNDFMSY